MAAAIASCAPTGGSDSPANLTSASSAGNPTSISSPSSPYRIGSMASEFLQSKTQTHILDDDDKVAPGCQQKRFVKADVVSMPTINTVGLEGIAERKWIEQWTLDRCGTSVAYDVYYTVVGDGSAYFAVVGP